MDTTGTGLNSTQRQCEGSSVKEKYDHGNPAGVPMWSEPLTAFSSSEAVPPPQLPSQTVTVDPRSLGFSWSCQYPQGPADPEYLTSGQYHILTGPAPVSSDSSHVSSLSTPWFMYEPMLCSMMPGDILTPVAGLFIPQAVDQQQIQGGLAEFTPPYPQPVMCSVAAGGQEGPVNPSEPGPVFHTLKPAAMHIDDSVTHNRGNQLPHSVSMSGTSLQYQQTAHPPYEYRDQIPSRQPQPPPARTFGSRKPCRCTKSKCLKLYCECFANGLMCNNCECSNCFNNEAHAMIRQKAIESRSGRNPDTFRTKKIGWHLGEGKGWHNKGCSCKRSGCLKNYCECYEANVMCTSSCKCNGCRNFNEDSKMGPVETMIKESRGSGSVITHDVVEAVCGCLLAQADRAERETQNTALAEKKVLEEFGNCLEQIAKAMFK